MALTCLFLAAFVFRAAVANSAAFIPARVLVGLGAIRFSLSADRIVVADQGRIVELGSTVKRVPRAGRDAEMYATWISHATRISR